MFEITMYVNWVAWNEQGFNQFWVGCLGNKMWDLKCQKWEPNHLCNTFQILIGNSGNVERRAGIVRPRLRNHQRYLGMAKVASLLTKVKRH